MSEILTHQLPSAEQSYSPEHLSPQDVGEFFIDVIADTNPGALPRAMNEDLELIYLPDMQRNDQGETLLPHQRGEAIAQNWQGLERMLARNENVDFNSVLRPIVANFRTYIDDKQTDTQELFTNPILQDVLCAYGAIETAYKKDFASAGTTVNQINAPHLKEQLSQQLSAATEADMNFAESTAVSTERSAQNLERFEEVVSRNRFPVETIRSAAESVDTSSVGVGINVSSEAISALIDPYATGRILNKRELPHMIKQTGDAQEVTKLAVERELGYSADNIFMAPPVYGALISNNEHGGGAAAAYGDFLIELNEDAQKRATYTYGDSHDETRRPARSAQHAKDIQLSREDAVKAYAYGIAVNNLVREHLDASYSSDGSSGYIVKWGSYIEAQIAGVSLEDVQSITLPTLTEGVVSKYDPGDIAVMAQSLTKKGISVKIPYELSGKRSNGPSRNLIGESFDAFAARMHAIDPAIIVEDRRTEDQLRAKVISEAAAKKEVEDYYASDAYNATSEMPDA